MDKPLVLFLLLLLLPATLKGFPETPLLSLQQCIQIALAQNPAAKAAEEGIIAAEENIGMAKAPYYPDLRLSASYNRFQTHLFFPPVPSPLPGVTIKVPSILGPFNDWTLHISSHYVLYDSGFRRAKLLEAKSQYGEALEENARIQQEITLNISLAFYGLLADEELLDVAKQSLKRTEEQAALANDRYKAGSVPYSDTLRAQVKISTVKLAKVKAENIIRIAQGNLNAYMGLPPQTVFDIQPVHGEFVLPIEIDLETALVNAEHDRPEIQAALHRINALCQQRKQARAAYGPKVIAQGYYGRCDDDFFPQDPDWSIGIGFEMPLFQGFETRHHVNQVEAQWRKQWAEYEQIALEVKKNAWDAYSTLLEAYESIQSTSAQVKDAQESLRLIQERYKAGASILTDMLDAETALASTQANFVNAKWQYHAAYRLFLWAQGK
jgi:outer membrane protein